MKANEAPEKIYVTEWMIFVTNPEITLPNNDKVEYTRTDAFIEKALEWIRKEIRPYYSDVKYKYEDFKYYMKS